MTSIEENGGYVEHIQPKEENKCEAIAENTINKGASNSGFQKTNTKLLKQELSFAAVVALDGHKFKRTGSRLVCLCPFHKEKTPSFNVEEDDIGGRCYGCDWHGDIFEYEMKAHRVPFSKAVERLERKKTKTSRKSVVNVAAPKKTKELTVAQVTAMQEAASCLAGEDAICNFVAGSRQWKAGTIQHLAKQGYLGWYQGSLAFIYQTGMKLRKWPDRDIWWAFGGPSIWRANEIENAQHVFITEGETDLIRLVDCGLEKQDGVRVIALPSATSNLFSIAGLLEGKKVTLCLDSDEAGQRATEKVIALLRPVCTEVKVLDLGEVSVWKK